MPFCFATVFTPRIRVFPWANTWRFRLAVPVEGWRAGYTDILCRREGDVSAAGVAIAGAHAHVDTGGLVSALGNFQAGKMHVLSAELAMSPLKMPRTFGIFSALR